MKIDKVLIHNGISYGIPEGTKVPEKPHNTGTSVCACKDCMDYMYAFQALLSVAIQWEDQRIIKSWLPDAAFTRNEDDEGVTVDGIYPLEGVNGEQVWQYKTKGYADWSDCVKTPIHFNERFELCTRFERVSGEPPKPEPHDLNDVAKHLKKRKVKKIERSNDPYNAGK